MSERSIFKTIDEMLAVVPVEERDFRLALEGDKTAALYKAPEILPDAWIALTETVNYFLPQDRETLNLWQRAVVRAFEGPTLRVPRQIVEDWASIASSLRPDRAGMVGGLVVYSFQAEPEFIDRLRRAMPVLMAAGEGKSNG